MRDNQPKRNTPFVKIRDVIDGTTGEVLDFKQVRINKVHHKTNWIKTMTDNKLYLDLSNPEKNLLYILACKAEYGTGKIAVLNDDKEQFAKDLNYEGGDKTIENILTGLVKKKALKRIQRGKYMINPSLYWNGSDESRQKALQIFYEDVKTEGEESNES